MRLSLNGSRLNVYRGRSLLQARATADAMGFGDIAVRGKINLLDRGGSGLAVIEEVRLPTGREEDLLGAGEASFRTVFIGSSEFGRIAAHGNFGATFRRAVGRHRLSRCGDGEPVPQLTLVGELLGRRIADVGSLVEERVPPSLLAGIDTIRLVSTAEASTPRHRRRHQVERERHLAGRTSTCPCR